MSGIEMIRKTNVIAAAQVDEAAVGGEQDEPAYGVTMPLLTTAAGEKFGKSAGNAVWLDPTMTSPFQYYQVSTLDDLGVSADVVSAVLPEDDGRRGCEVPQDLYLPPSGGARCDHGGSQGALSVTGIQSSSTDLWTGPSHCSNRTTIARR